MEDIRFKNSKNKHINFISFWNFIKNNWVKLIIILIILSIIIFPTYFGTFIGTWWSNFINAFHHKTILLSCL